MNTEPEALQQQPQPTPPPCGHEGCTAHAVVQGTYGFRCGSHVPIAPGEYVIAQCVRIKCRCGHVHVIVDKKALAAAEQQQDIGAPCNGCRHITRASSKSRIVLARALVRR